MAEPAGPIKSFFKYFQRYTFSHMCFAITFFTSGFLVNLVQASLYWTLRYTNKRLYRKINYYLLYTYYSQLVFVLEWWADNEIIVYMDKDDYETKFGKEHILGVMNHSFEIDWLVGWQLADSVGLTACCKGFAKKATQYVPIIGWGWKFSEGIFLERSFEKDEKIIRDQIRDLGDYPDPLWLLLCPEGTRLSPSKLEASQKFARERGLPVLKHHLLPRTKGFVISLQAMRDKIKVIYSMQLAYHKDAESPPTMRSMLGGKAIQSHMYIRRIPVEDLPHDEEAVSKWLLDHFEMKDRMQDSFYKTGSFFKESGVKPIAPIKIKRRIYPLIHTAFWSAVILIPFLFYTMVWLITGEFTYFFGASCFMGFFYFPMKKLISLSEVSKSSSSYGVSKKE